MEKLTNAKDLLKQVQEQSSERYEEIMNIAEEKRKEYLGRGGKRSGAGAKRKAYDNEPLNLQIRVSVGEYDFLKRARELKLNLDEALKKM